MKINNILFRVAVLIIIVFFIFLFISIYYSKQIGGVAIKGYHVENKYFVYVDGGDLKEVSNINWYIDIILYYCTLVIGYLCILSGGYIFIRKIIK